MHGSSSSVYKILKPLVAVRRTVRGSRPPKLPPTQSGTVDDSDRPEFAKPFVPEQPFDIPVQRMLAGSVTYVDVYEADLNDPWSTAPYPRSSNLMQNEAFRSMRPKTNPRETSILLFPGQGSQFVGMAKGLLAFPAVKPLFAAASEILGYDLLDICLNGPAEKLNRTVYCQPAVFVSSLAAIERLKEQNPKAIENCVSVAGFSVGEFAALVFTGAMSYQTACELVKVRAELMQEASEAQPSGLMTVFVSPKSRLYDACQCAIEQMRKQGLTANPVCQVANYLFPECKVLGGHEEALRFVENNTKEFGLLRTKRLPVSGAFHTPLMETAAERFGEVLRRAHIVEPLLPVQSNVDAKRYVDGNDIKKKLKRQMCRAVQWEQVMHSLYDRNSRDGFPQTYEVGPGNQLGTMLRKTNLRAGNSCTHIPP